jgi:ATP-dependent protease ClpP protease subunit
MKLLSILTFFLFTVPIFSHFRKEIKIESIVLKPGNHLFLTSEVNDDNKELFISGNNRLTTKNIYVYINSNGGSVLSGNDIIENIKFLNSTGYNITCIAQKAYSMAFHIFQHCKQRYITSSSTLMQHQMSLGINGNYENIKTYLEMIEKINEELINYSAKRLKLTSKQFKNNIMNDWWFYGKNAIQNNAADKIITIGCSPTLYNMKYIKKKRKIDFKDLFSNNKNVIELNGCPLLH